MVNVVRSHAEPRAIHHILKSFESVDRIDVSFQSADKHDSLGIAIFNQMPDHRLGTVPLIDDDTIVLDVFYLPVEHNERNLDLGQSLFCLVIDFRDHHDDPID